jgi:adenine phosphoribosyltransferase
MDLSLSEAVLHTARMVPDYPSPGIKFQDITPILADADLFARVAAGLAAGFAGQGITHVVGIEARGFILAAPVAIGLRAGFVPVRKAGKLPWKSRRKEYQLEYGTSTVEAHIDAVTPGCRVLVVDDVLATGGTAAAAAELVRELGATVVGWSFLLEIGGLGGRGRLVGAPIHVAATVPD